LAVKLLTVALATAAGGGTPLDLLARVPASVANLGAALLVFEVLRARRPLQLAARSAILVAVSPVLFVASGIHGDPVGVAVALLLAVCLLVDRDAPLVAGITLALASRVEPMVLLAPLALSPAWSVRDLVWPAVFGYLGDARWASIYAVAAGATCSGPRPGGGRVSPGTAGSPPAPSRTGRWPAWAWSPGWSWAPGRSSAGAPSSWRHGSRGGVGGCGRPGARRNRVGYASPGVGPAPGGFGAPANGSSPNGSAPTTPTPGR